MKRTNIKYLIGFILFITTSLFFIGTSRAEGYRNASSYTLLDGSHHMGTLSDTYSDDGNYLIAQADDYIMWS